MKKTDTKVSVFFGIVENYVILANVILSSAPPSRPVVQRQKKT